MKEIVGSRRMVRFVEIFAVRAYLFASYIDFDIGIDVCFIIAGYQKFEIILIYRAIGL